MDIMPPGVVRIDGEKLRHARENKSFSQRELAKEADVSPATILKIERGKAKNPHPSTVRKLAKTLGVEPRELHPED